MRKLLLQALFGAVLILISPAVLSADETQAAKKVVIAYNYGIIQMAKKSTVEHMVNILSKEKAQKLHLWIKSWHDNNLFMDTSLQKLDFTNVNIGKGYAKVFTDEEWIYRYINIKSKRVTHPTTRIKYKMRYELKKMEHGWVIDDTKVLSESQEILDDTRNGNK